MKLQDNMHLADVKRQFWVSLGEKNDRISRKQSGILQQIEIITGKHKLLHTALITCKFEHPERKNKAMDGTET